ncbi:methyltransferase, FxLD system [Streptomyces sp. NBC_01275]|uniref:methyltransferase, FxLD system n=1 Tax=Streptomyces sp. NBC_01275 TaxID=2903807 RepID=UPI00224F910B|nr:methyltransferase, FxLD system [Streptomyces sp. NBC_01275]MCX4760237.1 methyltransferase, FxLD system [Streptomyces sp. NBC_01275]
MGYTTPDEWDAHYTSGRSFHGLGEAERRLLAEHLPAPEGGLALDVGCGLGELARHLTDIGYEVDAVDHAPAALDLARNHREGGEGIVYRRFDIEQDSLDDLPRPVYDLIVFRLSWAFVRDRTRVTNRLRERLRPGGALCVITPVATSVTDDRRNIALDEDELALLGSGWSVVERHDADGLAFVVLRDPVPAPDHVRCAAKGRPSPHALTGAGVVVTDPAGRILLGWSVRGVWELPGGKNDADEDYVDTAVRELEEETGLKADPANARLLAFLMDSVHGIPRMTAAVRITDCTGEPTVAEPHLLHRLEWHEVSDLPTLAQPLFTPSAHVIDTVWPGLLTGLPPVRRYPIAPTERSETPGVAQQAAEAVELRHAMADRLVAEGRADAGGVIEAAFRQVPRHRFLPGIALAEAYAVDQSPVTRHAPGGQATSSVSAPWLQALMLRDAALRPGDTVVEIGSGGYHAALLQEVVGPHGTVISVDIDPYVTDRARRFLADTGYHRIHVHLGDGVTAPARLAAPGSVDAVVVTVEARDIPPAWIGALVEGGRLVVPLRVHGYTWSIPFTKRGGHLVADSFTVCGFVPLQGPGYREDAVTRLRGGEVGVRFADGVPVDTGSLEAALDLPRVERWTGVTVPGDVPFDMLLLWLATHLGDGFARIAVDADLDTGVLHRPGRWDAAALVRDGSLARLLTRRLAPDAVSGAVLWEFGVHAYGPHADGLADAMAGLVTAWDRDARDTVPRLTVHPAGAADRDLPEGRVLDKPHSRLVFTWPSRRA